MVHNKMARLREFDYEQVLDGALQLFWRGGYEATSLDGLLSEVGLSKSSFYGAFGSKHEMLLASLDRYIETVLQANIDDLRRGPPRAAIIRSFEKILGFQPSSKTCFLQVCAIERGGQDQLVRMRVRRGLELFEEALPKYDRAGTGSRRVRWGCRCPRAVDLSCRKSLWAPGSGPRQYRSGCTNEDSRNDNEGPGINFFVTLWTIRSTMEGRHE